MSKAIPNQAANSVHTAHNVAVAAKRRAFREAVNQEAARKTDEGLAIIEQEARRVGQEIARPLRPIDMILHCPKCGKQHIDAPFTPVPGDGPAWTNPPHRSHLCHGCGCIWRPCDVPTNGVEAIKTKGKNDNW